MPQRQGGGFLHTGMHAPIPDGLRPTRGGGQLQRLRQWMTHMLPARQLNALRVLVLAEEEILLSNSPCKKKKGKYKKLI